MAWCLIMHRYVFKTGSSLSAGIALGSHYYKICTSIDENEGQSGMRSQRELFLNIGVLQIGVNVSTFIVFSIKTWAFFI
jgi:hypothetical protein